MCIKRMLLAAKLRLVILADLTAMDFTISRCFILIFINVYLFLHLYEYIFRLPNIISFGRLDSIDDECQPYIRVFLSRHDL